MQRIVPLVLAWAVLLLALRSSLPQFPALLDKNTLLLVLLLPWASVSVAHSPAQLVRAVRAALRPDALLSPQECRSHQALLQSLGQASVNTGVILVLLAITTSLTLIATSSGSLGPMDGFAAYGGFVLGPIYGLLLKGFLYDPLGSFLSRAPVELD